MTNKPTPNNLTRSKRESEKLNSDLLRSAFKRTPLAMILPNHRHRCMGIGKIANGLYPHMPHSWLCYRPVCDEPKHYDCGMWVDALIRYKERQSIARSKQMRTNGVGKGRYAKKPVKVED